MFLFAMGQGNSHESTNHSDLIKLIDEESVIQFTINNIKYSVPKCIRPQTTLNYFIRNFAKLKGTKYMCLEGGCGVCIVAVKIKDEILAVNSCLVPIFLCNGYLIYYYQHSYITQIHFQNNVQRNPFVTMFTSWDIITIEGIGGKLADYNLLQKTLADMNGSQCGFCSPAMLFAEKEVQYAGQPYGMIVASDRYAAYEAVKKVKLLYENGPRKRPLLTVKEVLASNDKSRIREASREDASKPAGKDLKHTIKGTFESGSQYHFTMEPHVCVCIPSEDELDMFVSTQYVAFIQRNVSACLGIAENKINIKVRRVGGAYGGKLTRSSQVACACAMAAQKLKRPARMNLTIEDMMRSLGKRGSTYSEYEVGVDDLGKIQYLNWNHWINQGVSLNDARANFVVDMVKNCYDTSTWTLTVNNVITDLPCSTWCRAPGSAEGLATIANIIEHIARVTKRDLFDVSLQNVSDDDKERVTSMIDQIKKSSVYEDRRKATDLFNKENRWKKRGIGVSLMKFLVEFNIGFHALVSIYSRDGTVAITHGGIEMGQGINTKVAQVAAHTLGIDMDMIRVKPTYNLTSPNDRPSGASITSDCVTSATKIACEELLKRLQPVKDSLNNPTWQDITRAAMAQNVDLCATHLYNVKKDLPKNYSVYGVTVAEVEVDVLTGQHMVRRVDLLEDTGVSLSPEIDVGQVQGGFVMGMGLWTIEQLIYDHSTGALANDRTWNYKPPTSLDIPVDFRVSFLRNAPNPVGVLGSKTTGEPALCMSYAIPLAVRNALDSARADAGNTEVWYNLDGPLTNLSLNLFQFVKLSRFTYLQTVPKYVRSDTTLNYFIRNIAKLKGTKYMCLEGGCGVCIVAVKIKDEILARNPFVTMFTSWDIITIEGIGGKLADYNLLQKTLADMNGSQCGFCSPAMFYIWSSTIWGIHVEFVIYFDSLIARKRTSANDIENSFGSNICRCTGYRSILDAFQLFSTNTASGSSAGVRDIEDAHKSVLCLKKCASCNDFEMIGVNDPKPIYLKLKDADFFKVFTIGQIFEIFNKFPNASYILNGGNTGNGVYRISKKDIYLDINDVTELQNISKSADNLSVCSAVSLENMRACCQKYSKEDGFEYLNQLAYHIHLIGHLAMRNIGTIAGNLMLKHQHPEFQSDLFLILETAGAELHILESEGSKISSTFLDFMEIDMRHKLIYSVVLPRLESNYVYKTYKIMPRAQNAHAIVNAGFLFRLDDKAQVLEQPNIIFGGISAKFFHASETEKYLKGKVLLDSNTLKNALSTLGNELKPDLILPEASPEYRKKLAQALFYKFVLSLKPDKIDARLRSGGTMLKRPISSGKTDYNVDKSLWPVNKPITKIEAYYQTSGEAEYIDDIPHRDDEVFCAFVLAPATGPIDSIDASEALGMDGVVAFYSAKDVPGKNVFVDQTALITYTDELLFAEKEVQYAGQPYGMIVASDRYAAYEAVKKVKLIYENGPRKRPLLTVEEVFASNDKSRIHEITHQDASKPAGKNVKNTIKGTLVSGSQYHFTMEPHVCFCIPLEDELNMFASTQFITFTHRNVSACLGIPENKINIKVRRVGGAYGVRLTRSSLVACACAMAAQKLQRPARMYMTIEDMMQAVGKRIPTYSEYEVGIDDVGKIQYLNWNYWANKGISMNDTVPSFTIEMFKNIYDTSTWSWTYNNVMTDLPSGAWCRSPGSAEGLAIIGDVMEQIARATHQDPFDVVLQNVSDDDRERVTSMIDQIKKTSEYEDRRKAADLFNKENRWKKRGVGTSVMKFHVEFGLGFHALVSVYGVDGTVSITHGGIEMGQGINTKVAQVAAYTLGIDMDMIRVKPTNNLTGPNDGASGGSMASDCCASVSV
ncbi:hypothetical protein TSAR_010099 [Trichomalopsis sarcophagae]|uniref:FAD-binding PCMH-type domain-containing protein n=1 Tax=Trichomalopsis sarcophagae TaxID=543379 RepID=A0A232FFF4_9HYME|nr:hypothetical protein TSAR_010099 [Trichomalopsis sarcophagae]